MDLAGNSVYEPTFHHSIVHRSAASCQSLTSFSPPSHVPTSAHDFPQEVVHIGGAQMATQG